MCLLLLVIFALVFLQVLWYYPCLLRISGSTYAVLHFLYLLRFPVRFLIQQCSIYLSFFMRFWRVSSLLRFHFKAYEISLIE
jgi:hypothetical protein